MSQQGIFYYYKKSLTRSLTLFLHVTPDIKSDKLENTRKPNLADWNMQPSKTKLVATINSIIYLSFAVFSIKRIICSLLNIELTENQIRPNNISILELPRGVEGDNLFFGRSDLKKYFISMS